MRLLQSRKILSYKITPTGPQLYTLKRGNDRHQALDLKTLAMGVKDFEQKQNAKDIHRELRLVALTFEDGVPYGTIIGRHGADMKLPFTKTALQGLLSYVPGVNFRDMNHHWATDKVGQEITTALFTHCAFANNRDIMVRTIERAGVGRVIRSVHASGSENCYAPYSHSRMLDSLLKNATEFTHAPVVSMDLYDDYMRLRLASPKKTIHGYEHQDLSEFKLHEPIDTLNLKNSPTGKAALEGGGGLYTPICKNGMVRNTVKSKKTRRHVGNLARIDYWFHGAIESVLAEQVGIVQQYKDALAVQVSNIAEWTKQTLEAAAKNSRYQFLNDSIIEDVVVKGLTDETTPQGSTVAQAAQAVGLIAQKVKSFENEMLMEELADWTLRRGLKEAVGNRIEVVEA